MNSTFKAHLITGKLHVDDYSNFLISETFVMFFNVQYLDLQLQRCTLCKAILTFYDLEINLQILSIPKFLVDLTQLELTKGKQ